MSSYTYDSTSKLMVNYQPSVFHPRSADIAAVYDENQNPMVFSITNDGNASLTLTIADNITGINAIINLSDIWGIKRHVGFVSAFQDASKVVYLAFTEIQSNFVGPTNVHLCSATPGAWRLVKTVAIPLIQSASPIVVNVLNPGIFLVPSSSSDYFLGTSSFPLLVVVFQDSTSSTKAERITVDGETNTWSFVSGEMNLAVDPSRIVDMVVGSANADLVTLTTLFKDSKGNMTLQATSHDVTLSHSGSNVVNLTTPAGANRLCVIQNQDGYNDVLIGGNGVHYYSASRLQAGDSQPATELITPGDDTASMFTGILDMIVCQSGSTVPIWVRTSAGNVCTATVTTQIDRSIQLSQQPVPIVQGQVAKLSAIFHQPSQSHNFLFLDDKGYHNLLQYKPTNNLWDEQLWVTPDVDSNTYQSIQCYSTIITLKDVNGRPVPNTEISLSASDTASITANCTNLTVGTTPKSVATNVQGQISIISPVDGIGGSVVFSLAVSGSQIGIPINPATTVQDKLKTINSGSELRNAKLQSGK